MKGIVMQRGERKSIVLFNNGKIAEIPTGPNSEEGMVVTVSYNRSLIVFVCVMFCLALICAFFVMRSVYYKPLGYVQINYGSAAVELAYNRFERIVAVRPLSREAVEPIALLPLDNAAIETAYQKIMLSFASSLETSTYGLVEGSRSFPARGGILVRIAQDNLAGTKKIEQSLSLISSSFMAPSSSGMQNEANITFELYTLELYREAMTRSSPNPAISLMPQDGAPDGVPNGASDGASSGGQQMRHGRQNHGMRNMWCW